MKRHDARMVVVTVAAVFLLTSCVPPASTDGATSTTKAPAAEVAGTFDIGGGRKMYLECAGTGSPTVVFLSGLRGSAQSWFITASAPLSSAVFPQTAEITRVCAYDRPGTPVGETMSRSDPVPQPVTAGDMVADLHALLEAAGEEGPYILVGHSAGGLAARLYAATSPDEVAGLVLVDALSPGLQDAETPEQWEFQRLLIVAGLEDALARYPEIEQMDPEASFAEMRAASTLQPMPLVVLSADVPYGPTFPEMVAAGILPAGIPEDFGYVVDEAQRESQVGLARLVPGAEHITKTNSGHDIHQEQPQLVVEAIRRVVDAVRAEGSAQ